MYCTLGAQEKAKTIILDLFEELAASVLEVKNPCLMKYNSLLRDTSSFGGNTTSHPDLGKGPELCAMTPSSPIRLWRTKYLTICRKAIFSVQLQKNPPMMFDSRLLTSSLATRRRRMLQA